MLYKYLLNPCAQTLLIVKEMQSEDSKVENEEVWAILFIYKE